MKKLILIGFLTWGMAASANTISVEFQVCSNSHADLCAIVYSDLTTKRSYKQEEMLLVDDPSLSDSKAEEMGKKIRVWIGASGSGRSFATNIEGRVVSVKRINGSKYNKLIMRDFSTSGPRPRGVK